MAEYVGVDFGTSMIKAAAIADPGGTPRTLRLEPPEPFLAAAVELVDGGPNAGQAAFVKRRLVRSAIAFGFRDRVLGADRSIPVHNRSYTGVELQTPLLLQLGYCLGRAMKSDLAGLGFAIPDHWREPRWSLALAWEAAGVLPCLGVREWAAALASCPQVESDRAFFLSLGYGTARATVYQRRSGLWQPVLQHSEAAISGELLRKLLLKQIGDRITAETRKNWRDVDVMDQAVHDALERGLRSLIVDEQAEMAMRIGEIQMTHQLTRRQLAAEAEPLRAALSQFMLGILNDGSVGSGRWPVFAWGELALLLPVHEWLEAICPSHTPVRQLPLDVVSAGAARVCADFKNAVSPWTDECLASVCTKTGEYSNRFSNAATVAHVRIVERMPEQVVGVKAIPTGELVLLTQPGEGSRRKLSSAAFQLGRDSSADWVFPSSDYPTVSGQHAVIVRDAGRYLLRDLESSNGTYVNNVRVRGDHILRHGDVISLGQLGARLRFLRES